MFINQKKTISTLVIEKQPFRIHYRSGTADEAVLNESFDRDTFFKGVPEYRLKSDHIIIDIGAHIGCFSLLAASRAVTGKIYAFEPAAETYAVLQKNVQSNRLSNIKIFPLAVAGSNGTALLYHDMVTGNWGHSITKELSGDAEEVNCITLEHFLQSEHIDHVDFIKFNCEGAEFGIILNTCPPILKRIKCALILYHGFLETNISVKQMAAHLAGAGFHLHYRYKNKADNSGWLVAYQAGFFENLLVNLRTLPLRTLLFIKEMRRKSGRISQILFSK